MVNTPRLWERNPARPAPLQSLPGCRIPFIQQTSVCPAQLGHSALVLGGSSAGGSWDLFCFPVELAGSPRAVFGISEGSLLSWEQHRKEGRKLTLTVAHETQCWSRSFLQVMFWPNNH